MNYSQNPKAILKSFWDRGFRDYKKKDLTPLQFHVTQECGTETPLLHLALKASNIIKSVGETSSGIIKKPEFMWI